MPADLVGLEHGAKVGQDGGLGQAGEGGDLGHGDAARGIENGLADAFVAGFGGGFHGVRWSGRMKGLLGAMSREGGVSAAQAVRRRRRSRAAGGIVGIVGWFIFGRKARHGVAAVRGMARIFCRMPQNVSD